MSSQSSYPNWSQFLTQSESVSAEETPARKACHEELQQAVESGKSAVAAVRILQSMVELNDDPIARHKLRALDVKLEKMGVTAREGEEYERAVECIKQDQQEEYDASEFVGGVNIFDIKCLSHAERKRRQRERNAERDPEYIKRANELMIKRRREGKIVKQLKGATVDQVRATVWGSDRRAYMEFRVSTLNAVEEGILKLEDIRSQKGWKLPDDFIGRVAVQEGYERLVKKLGVTNLKGFGKSALARVRSDDKRLDLELEIENRLLRLLIR